MALRRNTNTVRNPSRNRRHNKRSLVGTRDSCRQNVGHAALRTPRADCRRVTEPRRGEISSRRCIPQTQFLCSSSGLRPRLAQSAPNILWRDALAALLTIPPLHYLSRDHANFLTGLSTTCEALNSVSSEFESNRLGRHCLADLFRDFFPLWNFMECVLITGRRQSRPPVALYQVNVYKSAHEILSEVEIEERYQETIGFVLNIIESGTSGLPENLEDINRWEQFGE
ncbi:hypothetical protein B0H11DRAFT_1916954 [Mycena galericulata]|nr:hypothetical protein B0H11DRAFT_1916954 [Mycena galericulata]